ncbi:MAG: glycosyltransferase family 4 protein [Pseudomonadota bacterium]
MHSSLLYLFAATFVAVGVLRRYATQLGLLDIPCARSSHTQITPRGGGGAFVAALLVWALFQPHSHFFPAFWFGGLPAALMIALVGLWDDYRSLSARVRLLVQCLAVGWALYALHGYWPETWMYVPILFVLPFWWIGGVWCTNLFNFMDGTDGFSASEAITVFGFAAFLFAQVGALDMMWWCLAVVSSVGAFFLWNFPRAKIFMGDAGSGFLGFMIAWVALVMQCIYDIPMALLGMVHGIFCFDATVTLIRRYLAGERVMEAHRKHAFQRLNIYGWSHRKILYAKCLLNSLLVGLCLWTWFHMDHIWITLALELALLVGAYRWIERKQPMFY